MAFPGLGIVLRTFWWLRLRNITEIILGTLPRFRHHVERFCLEILVLEPTSILTFPVPQKQ